MFLKDSQQKAVDHLSSFFNEWKRESDTYTDTVNTLRSVGQDSIIPNIIHPVNKVYESNDMYRGFADLPLAGSELYPRLCLQVPTGGGKTLLGIETIRLFQESYAEKRHGLVVWIVHSEAIYDQTIQKLKDKTNPYRQILDQISGNKTIIAEKGSSIMAQDVEENLVVLMLMIQSANQQNKDNLKIFRDNGVFMDFFPYEHEIDKTNEILDAFPSLEYYEDPILNHRVVKTSLGNIVRVCNPLFIVDEFHKIYSEAQREVLDSLNPRCIIGLSATPKQGMNILVRITGMDLYKDEMIKLPINVRPELNENWREMIQDVRSKREELEEIAINYKENRGDYIRPIALLQVERTGRDKRDGLHVHADDVKDYLVDIGIPISQIAIKSAYVDDLKDEELMSRESEIRYIITKQALMEGWDCPFVYVLGVIPYSRSVTALTQLVGRTLRQPYTKRTGVPELDQCYTYFNHPDGQDLLAGIKRSLEADGLEDIVDAVRQSSGPSGQHLLYHEFPVQEKFMQQYSESLRLPMWHIRDGSKVRLLSYGTDILPNIKWETVDVDGLVKSLLSTVGKQKIVGKDLKYYLGGEYSGEGAEYTKESFEGGDVFVAAQVLSQYIPNPFVSYAFVKKVVDLLLEKFSQESISKDFGYITHEMLLFVQIESQRMEEALFNDLVQNGTVFLGITDLGGYNIPATSKAPAKIEDSEVLPVKSDSKSLYLAVDYATMNNLEKSVVRELQQQDKVIWWTRNKVDPTAYRIQAWRKNKIYPDFIIAKKNDNDDLELIYILESKGDQLIDNADTSYKQLVFQKMTEVQTESKDRKFSSYEYRLSPESSIESELREMLK